MKRSSLAQGFHTGLVGLCYFFLYLPILVILVFSLNDARFPAPWAGLTFRWYYELLFESPFLWDAFSNSLLIAVCSTLTSLILGLLLILHVSRRVKQTDVAQWFYGNLLIPETVLAVALLSFFALLEVPLGITTLVAGHTILGLGYVVPILYARFSELDPRMREASLALGATELQTFFKITVPLLMPAIIACSMIVFIISFDDFALSYFCSGSDYQTLSLYLLSMLRSEIPAVVNALSAVLILISTLFSVTFFSLRMRGKLWA